MLKRFLQPALPSQPVGGCVFLTKAELSPEIVVDVVAELAHITFRVWLEQDWRRQLVAILLFSFSPSAAFGMYASVRAEPSRPHIAAGTA